MSVPIVTAVAALILLSLLSVAVVLSLWIGDQLDKRWQDRELRKEQQR